MQIVISGIPIDIHKKNIKNMHLQIKPPNGQVVISAPLSMDDKAIEVYARTNLGWIKKQIEKFQQQPRSAKGSMLVAKLCTFGENSTTYLLFQILERIVLKFRVIA